MLGFSAFPFFGFKADDDDDDDEDGNDNPFIVERCFFCCCCIGTAFSSFGIKPFREDDGPKVECIELWLWWNMLGLDVVVGEG